jgi:DNA-directed RNA polymerase subunit RPC12/RpoP
MENTLIRSEPCPECGAELVWTQNAWPSGETTDAAYRCHNGHVLDPATTRQCPECGVHDTRLVDESDGRENYRCARCSAGFTIPR